jgi:hypothetical protein
VRGGVENYIIQLKNKLDFEGTKKPGNLCNMNQQNAHFLH